MFTVITLVKDFIKYLIKGAVLMLASYSFSFITQWITGRLMQMVLQVFVMAIALYFLDGIMEKFLPFIEGMLGTTEIA